MKFLIMGSYYCEEYGLLATITDVSTKEEAFNKFKKDCQDKIKYLDSQVDVLEVSSHKTFELF